MIDVLINLIVAIILLSIHMWNHQSVYIQVYIILSITLSLKFLKIKVFICMISRHDKNIMREYTNNLIIYSWVLVFFKLTNKYIVSQKWSHVACCTLEKSSVVYRERMFREKICFSHSTESTINRIQRSLIYLLYRDWLEIFLAQALTFGMWHGKWVSLLSGKYMKWLGNNEIFSMDVT